ncbi:MAG: EamA family transporter [Lachnospirales bacterium]
MLKMWVILVLLYGILKGIRDVIKKKALEKSTVMEVLFFYTVIGFIMVTPTAPEAFKLDISYIGIIAVKSLIVFSAWVLGFKALKKLPVSFYGVMDLSGVLFSAVMSVLLLGEVLKLNQYFGLFIVMIGLLAVNYNKGAKNEISLKYAFMALISCILNATSGIMDKVLMKSMTSSQLQFWFMAMMVVFYFLYILITREKVNWKCIKDNLWIILMSVLFVVGDKALFVANSMPDSSVSVMTVLKQSACFVTIIGGRLVFKEKNIIFRLICAVVIVIGIFISVL